MSRHMRTTVRLDDGLLRQAKQAAKERGETLTTMIEEGLRLLLANSQKRHSRKRLNLPVSRVGGGTLPGIDLSNSAALLDRMEGRR
jgi:hypothetical protein